MHTYQAMQICGQERLFQPYYMQNSDEQILPGDAVWKTETHHSLHTQGFETGLSFAGWLEGSPKSKKALWEIQTSQMCLELCLLQVRKRPQDRIQGREGVVIIESFIFKKKGGIKKQLLRRKMEYKVAHFDLRSTYTVHFFKYSCSGNFTAQNHKKRIDWNDNIAKHLLDLRNV